MSSTTRMTRLSKFIKGASHISNYFCITKAIGNELAFFNSHLDGVDQGFRPSISSYHPASKMRHVKLT
ncbi:hypothetical protein MTR_6g015355 [Medicago truncatula]|uniref:Uncharacterized protein n=1 Tax=Medicago truncatula TaxID=3880 RepID=A0A072U5W9_MEDTR|nr:hypothetical protein MTR_6g015355 [Medicago truncatula]